MSRHLRAQDLLLALKLAARGNLPLSRPTCGGSVNSAWTQVELALSLHVDGSEVEDGLNRLTACHLYNALEQRVARAALYTFLVGGLRYVFPSELGPFGEGMPTAFSVGPLAKQLQLGDEDGMVWPATDGVVNVRGRLIEPLYPTAPLAAAEDPILYEYLALVDALRIGRARERSMAGAELKRRLLA